MIRRYYWILFPALFYRFTLKYGQTSTFSMFSFTWTCWNPQKISTSDLCSSCFAGFQKEKIAPSVVTRPVNLCMLRLLINTDCRSRNISGWSHGLRMLSKRVNSCCWNSLRRVIDTRKGAMAELRWGESHLTLRRNIVERICLQARDVSARCSNPYSWTFALPEKEKKLATL